MPGTRVWCGVACAGHRALPPEREATATVTAFPGANRLGETALNAPGARRLAACWRVTADRRAVCPKAAANGDAPRPRDAVILGVWKWSRP